MLFPLVHESGFLSFVPFGSMLRVQKGCEYTKLGILKHSYTNKKPRINDSGLSYFSSTKITFRIASSKDPWS